MKYRVTFGPGAGVQYQELPESARDALVVRAAELADAPWDADVAAPGDDPAFRETMFDHGRGFVSFYVEEATETIRIFNIVWAG